MSGKEGIEWILLKFREGKAKGKERGKGKGKKRGKERG